MNKEGPETLKFQKEVRQMKKGVSILIGLLVVWMSLGALVTQQKENTKLIEVSFRKDWKKCTSLIVGKDATADGSVLLAHNEDLGGHAAHHLIVVPRKKHELGEAFKLYSGGEIPQVKETYAYIASTIFDMDYVPGTLTSGINEYQVAIGNNVASSRKELVPPEKIHKGGIIWTEFAQIALERTKTAREAVEIMGHLSEEYWLSADPGTMFVIADANEGWIIEIPRGGQWVAKRVPDDGYAVIANTFRIGEVDCEDEENFLCSKDLINFAVERGWYDPASGEPFNFAKVYGNPRSLESVSNTRRHWRCESLLADFAPEVKLADVMSIMRDHLEGTEYDLTNKYETSPHRTRQRVICVLSTEVSMVAQLRNWLPAEIGGVAWWALSTPCTSVYIPWYMGILEVPYAYQIGTNEYDEESAYWAFNRLPNLVDAKYGNLIGDVRAIWADIEPKALALQEIVEEVALRTYDKDRRLARLFLTYYSNALGMKALNEANKLADELIAKTYR